jgi:hypothetical protein
MNTYTQKLQQLMTLGKDKLLHRDESIDYASMGINEEDTNALIDMALDEELYYDDDPILSFAPHHAINALLTLRSKKGFGPVVDLLLSYDILEDDYLQSLIIQYIKVLENESFEDLKRVFCSKYFESRDKITLLDGLSGLARKNDLHHKEITQLALQTLEHENNAEINAFIVMVLADSSGAQNIDAIRRIFKTRDVDCALMGDLEDIEIRLGLRKERETPQRNYFLDSMFNDFNQHSSVKSEPKIGRNDPCPCGSGKKYKKCCMT